MTPLILNIDTATENASVSITDNGKILGLKYNDTQKEHASFVHVAVEELMNDLNMSLSGIDAVAITSGPGSYTGLRVSMAAAKGFCYALNKPLIAINTLEVMARAALDFLQSKYPNDQSYLLCPMIDARRMEVFTAIYDKSINILLEPCAKILETGTFQQYENENVYFFGNGSNKLVVNDPSHKILKIEPPFAGFVGIIANERYNAGRFADTVYIEPEYFKEFFSSNTNVII